MTLVPSSLLPLRVFLDLPEEHLLLVFPLGLFPDLTECFPGLGQLLILSLDLVILDLMFVYLLC